MCNNKVQTVLTLLKSKKKYCYSIKVCICTRIESGSDDPDNMGHIYHFLVGQVVSSAN